MKRIKHRNLLPYFIDDERSLAKRRAYVASCEKFFKELSGKRQASSCKRQAASSKRQAASPNSNTIK
jgi:hypothetical protein